MRAASLGATGQLLLLLLALLSLIATAVELTLPESDGPIRLRRAPVSGVSQPLSCDYLADKNTTCVINSTHHYDTDVMFIWAGSVEFRGGAVVGTKRRTSLRLNVGHLTLLANSKLTSLGTLIVQAKSINLTNGIATGLDAVNVTCGGGAVTICDSQLSSHGNLSIQASTVTLTNKSAAFGNGSVVVISAGAVSSNNSQLISGKNLTIQAKTLTFTNKAVATGHDSANVNCGKVTLSGSSWLGSHGHLTINSTTLTLVSNSIASSDESLEVTCDDSVTIAGNSTITSPRTLTVQAQTLTMSQTSQLTSKGDLFIEATSQGPSVALNSGAIVSGQGDVNMTCGGKVSITNKSQLASQGSLIILAASVVMKGQSVANGRGSVQVTFCGGAVMISDNSHLSSHENLIIKAAGTNLESLSRGIDEDSVQPTRVFSGSVTITGDALVSSEDGDVHIYASSVEINSAKVNANGQLILAGIELADPVTGRLMVIAKCIDILSQSGLSGGSVSLSCSSAISLATTAAIIATDATEKVLMTANDINLDAGSQVCAARLSIQASGNVNIATSLPGLLATKINPAVLCAVYAVVGLHLMLGQPMGLMGGSPWILQALSAYAGTITVLPGQAITTNGLYHGSSNCSNRPNVAEDLCWKILGVSNLPALSAFNVSFDLMLAASTALNIQQSTTIISSSIMFCSNETATFANGVVVDVSGRACGPGLGQGVGGSSPSGNCGSGGGSHVGSGGMGAQIKSQKVDVCTQSGPTYDTPDKTWSLGYLPTASASGGGCGVPAPCPRELYPALYTLVPSGDDTLSHYPSAGGGLIWLSSASVDFTGRVTFKADGTPGTSVPFKFHGATVNVMSGAGSGGQIFLYGSVAADSMPNSVTLSVRGGATQCNDDQVGGAGGGGFIGLLWRGAALDPSVASAIDMSGATDGGTISKTCLTQFASQGDICGEKGKVMSLSPCPAGYEGLFCAPCASYQYNAGSLSKCSACENKPRHNSEYIGDGAWPNKTCPYKCSANVPNVISNKLCRTALQIALEVYGGTTGLGCALGVLGLMVAFAVCRRTAIFQKRMIISSRRASVSFSERESDSRCFKRCCGVSNALTDDTVLTFTRERLPFHIGRVFLYGSNTTTCPWALTSTVPAIVKHLVLPQQWQRVVAEIDTHAEAAASETYLDHALRVCYPPLVPMYRRWQRRFRARRLEDVTRQHSEGKAEGRNDVSLWMPIRARNQEGVATGELVMTFGYDSGATLAYLDFFDFAISQLDWAPPDLGQDARLLVAHGHGSYAEPFALDMGDPVVGGLGHAGLGMSAVYSVISKFNEVARLVPFFELESGDGRLLKFLRKNVKHSARQCGLTGRVEVFVVPQLTMRNQEVPQQAAPDEEPSFIDLHTSASTGCPVTDFSGSCQSGQLNCVVPSKGNSGSMADSVLGPTTVNTVGSLNPSGKSSASLGPALVQKNCVETRLCLAFGQFSTGLSALPQRSSGHDYAGSGCVEPSLASSRSTACELPFNPGPLASALTSPFPTRVLSSHLWDQRSCSLAELSCCMGFWRGSINGTTLGSFKPSTCLLLVVVLFFADLMAFLMIAHLLFVAAKSEPTPGWPIVALWFFVPPLTQVLAAITGPVFVVSEDPQLGRLFAGATALGIANSTALLVALLWFYGDSWQFTFLQYIVACGVKVALFFVTNVHINNLEIAHDLRFMGNSDAQCDFLDRERPDPVQADTTEGHCSSNAPSMGSAGASLLSGHATRSDDSLVDKFRALNHSDDSLNSNCPIDDPPSERTFTASPQPSPQQSPPSFSRRLSGKWKVFTPSPF